MQMFADSFDFYASTNDLTNYWEVVSPGNIGIQTGRFIGSRSLSIQYNSGGADLQKSSGQNDAIHHINVAAYWNQSGLTGTSQGASFTFSDGANNQCTIQFLSNGSIVLLSGGSNGTILSTYANAITASTTWFSFEMEVVINNTTGSWTVRTNGSPTNSFQATGLNTRAGSTNNYANRIIIWTSTTGSPTNNVWIDDFIWRSDPTSVPWLGDMRAYVQMPNTDVQAQFSRNITAVTTFISTGTTWQNGPGANSVWATPITATYTGTCASISINLVAGVTGHINAALYDNSTNNVLIATATALTNPVTGIITFTFATPPAVTKGVTYWMAVMGDVAFNVPGQNASNPIRSVNQSYASGFPATLTGWSVATQLGFSYLGITVTPGLNNQFVNEAQQDGLTTYVYSSTVGQNDLYSLPSLPGTTSVFAVTTRGFMEKGDAGSRSGAVQVRSGTTASTVRPWPATTSTSQSAGIAQGLPFTANSTGSISTVTISVNTSATAHVKAALYNAAGTTLLGTSNEITNPTAGTNTFIFSPAVSVTNGTTYILATDQDASVTYNTTGAAGSMTWQSIAYASFPGANAPTGNTNNTPPDITVYIGSSTTVQSTPLVLATNFLWNWRTDLTDPNTSAAWTTAAVNALQIGPVVQA